MSTPDPSTEQLEVHILATAGLVRRAYDLRLEALGLNITESGLLQYLAREQPLTQSALAQLLHIGRMATGAVVKSLAERDLLERTRDPDDGRAWLIRLTPSGEKLATACRTIDREVVRALRAGLDRDDQKTLHRLLAAVRANAAFLADVPDAPDAAATTAR